MAEDIYGTGIPHLKDKTVWRKVQYVEPVKITSVPQIILDKYKEVTIFCDLTHTKGIGFLNTISHHIMFTNGIMIKTKKLSTLQIESHRCMSHTCSAVSISHTCTMIGSSNQYRSK